MPSSGVLKALSADPSRRGGRRPLSLRTLASQPGIEGVLADRLERGRVGLERGTPAPGHVAVGETQAGEGLGERLARVAEVVQALVAGEESPRPRAPADVLVARPASACPNRSPPGTAAGFLGGGRRDGRTRERRRFAARPVGGARVVAVEDDLVFAGVVTGLGAVAAIEFDLRRGVELDGEQFHLGAVDQVPRASAICWGSAAAQAAWQAGVTEIATVSPLPSSIG